ncbi:MAG: aldose 1-epimerase [Oligoflexia bacterium]|nr:aldose 1-epimerase [Oligoflexia bacterium]
MAIELSSDSLKFSCAPEIGGSILDLSVRHQHTWVQITRQVAADVKRSSDTAGFLMLPYPNRIAQGRFSFDGRSYELQNAEKHAIHGCVRDREWQVAGTTKTSCVLKFDSRDYSEINYPFPFSAELQYALTGNTLDTRLMVRNEGTARMPLGCGFHPYFRRSLGKAEEVQLQYQVSGVYPATGTVPLPTAMAVPIDAELDFTGARPLKLGLDHCFSGWDGRAALYWPGSKIAVRLESDPALRHLVIYSPADADSFAFEPQSQMIDGFNYLARGYSNTGVAVLEPRAAWSCGFRLIAEA